MEKKPDLPFHRELCNAEFCNLKIDFLILQTIHQDVYWDDGTGSDGRRIL